MTHEKRPVFAKLVWCTRVDGSRRCFPRFGVVLLRFLVVISRFEGGDFAFWGVFSRYATIISRAARFFLALFPAGP